VQLLRKWLAPHAPAFNDFEVASSGKYLGWYLGRESVQRSFVAPLNKYNDRVQVIVEGAAPAALALRMYNQTAVTVISYVSQFFVPSKPGQGGFNLCTREHNAIHRVLRMPPKCMSRALMHSSDFCTGVAPIKLIDYATSCMYRFASSEKVYLIQLAKDVRSFCGIHAAVQDSALEVPCGLLDSKPILQNLLDALNFQGAHARLLLASRSHVEYRSIDIRNTPVLFDKQFKIQSVCMKALGHFSKLSQEPIQDLILSKTRISFGASAVGDFSLSQDWFVQLHNVLCSVKHYVRMCWLKTVAGAWTTTVRTHEHKNTDIVAWNCIFGCSGEPDQLDHYMCCPILWHIAGSVLPGEEYFSLGYRIGFEKPTRMNIQRLAIAHGIYHQCKHDSVCIVNCMPAAPLIVQSRAEGFALACFNMANGSHVRPQA